MGKKLEHKVRVALDGGQRKISRQMRRKYFLSFVIHTIKEREKRWIVCRTSYGNKLLFLSHSFFRFSPIIFISVLSTCCFILPFLFTILSSLCLRPSTGQLKTVRLECHLAKWTRSSVWMFGWCVYALSFSLFISLLCMCLFGLLSSVS